MDTTASDDDKVKYTTPHRVQAWFLGRSRDRWKQKYMDLKRQSKRLQNQVAAVTKSRAKWRTDAKELRQHLEEAEARNVELQAQLDALKKDGPDAAVGLG